MENSPFLCYSLLKTKNTWLLPLAPPYLPFWKQRKALAPVFCNNLSLNIEALQRDRSRPPMYPFVFCGRGSILLGVLRLKGTKMEPMKLVAPKLDPFILRTIATNYLYVFAIQYLDIE